MRKIREVLRLRWHQGLSVRETARSSGISVGVVQKMADRAEHARLDRAAVEQLGDVALEEKLDGRPAIPRVAAPGNGWATKSCAAR